MRRPIKSSRRDFLSLGLAAAGMAGLPLMPVRRSFAAGAAEFTVLSDGHLMLPLGFSYPDVPQDELKAMLAAAGQPVDSLAPDCNVTMLRSGDRLILFDVGAGGNFMPTAGKLADSLAAAGVEPDEVTDVIFTHGHPDHLWGLIDDFDEPVFANAGFHMSAVEWQFWTDPETVNVMEEARKTFAVGAASRLALIADRINLFAPGDEVVAGVEAVDTAGHTPGHTSFMVHGGGDPVLVAGDAISHPLISFEHPEWPSGADQDTGMGIRTRMALLDRLAADKAAIIGYHLPMPGQGRVERTDSAYRFAPDA
ncbi:glyoxylase-like metal-dependent hydrolase (beta-lactamase superfamily II) [Hoeflea marina]|uniref:Glyoxylase-like metal-dependent hydrolase (Beta-lactamase superfamily II) n=1 Tax=Hoeflea marina TaxID=274592 RepID=A0A317PX67_9HYPH|nr:MBL fold metallo-hydrolase [Hoeflea marina]PWW04090.1 glyoxylase-like metal-dependent hydrolase (beta-lactamase superfamily II) [Hoeflea marina]